jgi:hypothetical protein
MRRPDEGAEILMAREASNGPIAVLTGDLVRSTALSHNDLLVARDALKGAAAEIRGWARGAVHGPDFFRGDSWQLVLTDDVLLLRAAVYLRTALRALDPQADTRIAIGLGSVDALDIDSVSQSMGEAFTLSGRALDDMNRFEGFILAMPHWSRSQAYLPTVIAFCDHVVGAWSPSQAKVALEVLRPDDRTQEDVGKALGVSRQFVNKVYRQSGLSAVLMAVDAFEGLS